MNPKFRMLLEMTDEAAVDAGVNPEEIREPNGGVFVEAHEAGTLAADPQKLIEIPAMFCTDQVNVVSELVEWNGEIGVSSFGLGGGGKNVDAILQSNPQDGSGKETNESLKIPLVIPFSGQSKDSCELALQETSMSKINNGRIRLLNEIHTKNIPQTETQIFIEEIQNWTKSPKVWFVFNGMGSQWAGMGKSLMKFKICKDSLEKSAEILKTKNLDLLDLLINGKEEKFDNVLNSFVSIAAVQIALVDLLSALKIKPDGIVGHSVGELGAAYADNGLTAEQVILTAHARGQAILEMEPQDGAMAAVGLSWEEAMKKCPRGIYPACHNSKDSVTVSGPAKLINNFVDQLQNEGTFAKKINSSNQAFHSKYIQPARLKMVESLDKIITISTPRSNRWVSSSIPESQWNSDLAKTSSADYHVNNLISPVLFQEALEKVPESAVVIEIGPHCLLQTILKRSLPNCSHVGLLNKNHNDNSIFLCQSIDKMFNLGLNPLLSALYPKVSFPVLAKREQDTFYAGQKIFPQDYSPFVLSYKSQGPLPEENTGETDWVESIARILGLKAEELEKYPDKPFHAFGMDSIMTMEMQQFIQLICANLIISEDLQNLSLAKLGEMMMRDGSKDVCHKLAKNSKPPGKILELNSGKEKDLKAVFSSIQISEPGEQQSLELEAVTSTQPAAPGPVHANEHKYDEYEILRQFLAYFFSICSLALIYFILSPISWILRQSVKIHIWLLQDKSRVKFKFMDGVGGSMFVLENINLVHILKFQGQPSRDKIIQLLEERLFSGKSDAERKEIYDPFEKLKWSIEQGWLFCYWRKDENFDLARHVIFEQVSTSDLDGEMPRLANYYQNLKWNEHKKSARQWWEFRIVYSEKAREFLLVFSWNHAYGDGSSAIRLLQQVLTKSKSGSAASKQQIESNQDSPIEQPHFFENVSHCLAKTRKSLQESRQLIHIFAQLLLKTWDTRRSIFPMTSQAHAASTFAKFPLSKLKSVVNSESGNRFNLNAVVLTLCTRVFRRIAKEGKTGTGGEYEHEQELLPGVTWAPFLNSHSSLVNDSITMPIKIPATGDKAVEKVLRMTEKELATTGNRENVLLVRELNKKASDLCLPFLRLLYKASCRYSFVYTNILAILPKTKANTPALELELELDQEFKFMDMYAVLSPFPFTLTAITDSVNDSLNMTLTVSETILNQVSPEFHQLFFSYLEQEMNQL